MSESDSRKLSLTLVTVLSRHSSSSSIINRYDASHVSGEGVYQPYSCGVSPTTLSLVSRILVHGTGIQLPLQVTKHGDVQNHDN